MYQAFADWISFLHAEFQEVQGAKADLEVQLRVMRQERNALAATLRQHGLLGKLASSKTALPLKLSPAEKAETKAGIVKDHVHSNHTRQTMGKPTSCSAHQRQDSDGLQENHDPLESGQSPLPAQSQAKCSLQDVTNDTASVPRTTMSHLGPNTLPNLGVNTISELSPNTQAFAPQRFSVSEVSHSCDGSPVSTASDAQVESTQAKLRRLEQMAQLLLL